LVPRINIALVVGLVLASICCRPANEAESPRRTGYINLELEQVFGATEGFRGFASISAVVVDSQYRVYVLDAAPGVRNQLVCFSSIGDVTWSIDREGTGPGDLPYVQGFAWAGANSLDLANPRSE